MREFYLTLDKCFANGLRPTKSLPISSNYMSYLMNGKPTGLGLEPFYPVIKQWTYVQDWPFPQLFLTNKHQFLGTRNELTLKGVSDISCSILYSDDLWELISYFDFVVACKDGLAIEIRDPDTGFWTKYDAYNEDFPIFKTGCNFRGQAIVGNLNFWPTASDTARANWIAASNIGEFKFSMSRKNESMFRPCHWDGEVLSVRDLDKIVLVYGDDGIAGLFSADRYLGYKELADIGIVNKGAVGCSKTRHVFLGNDMKLRHIDSEMNIKVLDFSEYMSLLSGTILISYDDLNSNFYISDGVRCFVLSGERLFECHQLIGSCRPYGSETLAAYVDTGVSYFLGVTDTIDFGIRTLKTVNTIELGISGNGVYSVALDWRNKPSDAFTRTSFVQVNDAGVATIVCTAREFRLCVMCDSYEDLSISYATMRYKMGDMTSIRGVYAPPPRGQE